MAAVSADEKGTPASKTGGDNSGKATASATAKAVTDAPKEVTTVKADVNPPMYVITAKSMSLTDIKEHLLTLAEKQGIKNAQLLLNCIYTFKPRENGSNMLVQTDKTAVLMPEDLYTAALDENKLPVEPFNFKHPEEFLNPLVLRCVLPAGLASDHKSFFPTADDASFAEKVLKSRLGKIAAFGGLLKEDDYSIEIPLHDREIKKPRNYIIIKFAQTVSWKVVVVVHRLLGLSRWDMDKNLRIIIKHFNSRKGTHSDSAVAGSEDDADADQPRSSSAARSAAQSERFHTVRGRNRGGRGFSRGGRRDDRDSSHENGPRDVRDFHNDRNSGRGGRGFGRGGRGGNRRDSGREAFVAPRQPSQYSK
jgi:hypothetical protein